MTDKEKADYREAIMNDTQRKGLLKMMARYFEMVDEGIDTSPVLAALNGLIKKREEQIRAMMFGEVKKTT